MPTLQELMEHRPDPRIGRVNDYLDRGKRLAKALYHGFLSSIPQPQSGDVLVDDQGNWHGGQLPEETAYNTLAWLMPTGSVSEAAQFAREGFKPSTLRAITAYHGSPHKFDKFDMSKIGTGEGAQAYGHGLYFAESPEVAESYAQLGKNIIHYDGNALPEGSPQAIAAELLHSWQGDKVGALDDAAMYDNALAIKRHIKAMDPAKLHTGDNLYKTSLEWPDPAREAADPLGPQHFLDWDKPLSEQPEILAALQRSRSKHVRETLAGLGDLSEPIMSYGERLGPKTGNDFISRLSYNMEGRPTGSKASIAIGKTGIPGIRYLDQGSRGAGDGTYNYVVFDDQIPRITERNGVTLEDLFRR